MKICITIFTLLLVFKSSFAVELPDLYQARVAVEDKSIAAKNKATLAAFQSVLVKVGGKTTILTNDLIKEAIKNNNQYLTQYGYVNDGELLFLEANFDKERIRSLFQSAQLSVWGRHRPLVMVWFVEDSQQQRTLIADSSLTQIPQQIKQTAQLLGLPVVLPIMDLVDAQLVQLSDVWGRFAEPISEASERYGAEANVIIRLSDATPANVTNEGNVPCELNCEQKQFQIDWSLIFGLQISGEVTYGNDKQQLIDAVLNQVSENIYQRYAVNLDQQQSQTLFIDIDNINSLFDYYSVAKLLESLPAVQTTQLKTVSEGRYTFKLNVLGDESLLVESLSLDARLALVVNPLEKQSDSQTPRFKWK